MQNPGPFEAFESIGFKARLKVILIFLVAFVALSLAVGQIFSVIRANHIRAALDFVDETFQRAKIHRAANIRSGVDQPPVTYQVVSVSSDFFGAVTFVTVHAPIGGELHEMIYRFRGRNYMGVSDDLVR